MGRCVHRDAIISFEGDSCPICPILDDHVKDKDALRAQLTAAEEVAQYADYVIRNVVHGTPYDDALDIYIQKKVAYRNTYGKEE